jgi:hypothetical protein
VISKTSWLPAEERRSQSAMNHQKVGAPKKITPEISNHIDIVSSLDAALINFQIATMVTPFQDGDAKIA